MTAISYDGTYIAADSMACCDHIIVDRNYKKIHTFSTPTKFEDENVICVVLAGDLACITALMFAIKMGYKQELPKMDAVAYIVTDNSCYRVEADGSWYKDTAKQWAIGSGGEIAYSAMQLGKSAKEAVKHACKLVTGCGGKINVIQVRGIDRKKLRKKIIKKAFEDTAKLKEQKKLEAKINRIKKRETKTNNISTSPQTCERCNGDGAIFDGMVFICGNCQGEGNV